ncbi:hypothetical protein L6R52_02485 [Myxococcota bacterium]|nr:hypothetical protein [Myxococcota bacterium]
MVTAALVMIAALAAQVPDEPQVPMRAVVRVTHGRVSLVDAGVSEARAAKTGTLVGSGVIVETGQEGWVELHVLGAGRVRLSGGTRIALGEKALRLIDGRVWIDHADAIEERDWTLELPSAVCRIGRSTSVIVEQSARMGSTVVVRTGRVVIASGDEAAQLRHGQVATLAAGDGTSIVVRTGGVGLAELAELEASAVLGDLAGVRRFLLDRVASANVRPGKPRRSGEVLRSAPELGGVSAAAWDLEAALKAPPFFEDEVPPKGPNVRVEVGFDDD